jgi:pimeloyl-ACP methyl ester carboxylesterase
MTDFIPYEDFGGTGPILHFAHPNAYPPACFKAMLEPLAADYHVIAMHQRPLWPKSDIVNIENWQIFADDLAQFIIQKGYEQVIGVGHSLGAVATMKAAYQQPELFRALVLIEPVFLEPQILELIAQNPELMEGKPMVQKTRRRRTSWSDRRSAFDHYRAKSIFQRWPDETLWAYVNEGLVETGNDTLTLSFSREWEAEIYSSFPGPVWEEIPRIPQPTLAIRAAESDTLSVKAWQLWQARQPGATFFEIPDAGHMVPMERPKEIVNAIEKFLG